MKKIRLALNPLLLAFTLTATVFARPSHDEKDDAAIAAPVADELVPLTGIRRIKTGMTPDEVVASMRGKPDEQASAQVWIYWNFQGNKRPADMKQAAMIVFFTAGRVRLIRYSEAALVRKVLAEGRTGAPAAAIAAQ